MGIKYDSQIFIKIPASIKEQAEEKAFSESKTISEYIRNLIVKDLKRV